MKRCSNFLICVAIMLFLSCLLFGATAAKSTIETKKAAKKEKALTPISVQQREISDGLKRIEKKLLEEEMKINVPTD